MGLSRLSFMGLSACGKQQAQIQAENGGKSMSRVQDLVALLGPNDSDKGEPSEYTVSKFE